MQTANAVCNLNRCKYTAKVSGLCRKATFVENSLEMFKRILLIALVAVCSCQKKVDSPIVNVKSDIRHAKGLSIVAFDGYSIVTVSNPWPNASKQYKYILKKNNATVPDSLKSYSTINVPISKIVVTSTTHVPSLEMLGVENTLKGFPNPDYISSEKVRALIDAGNVKDLGQNQSLNTELLIEMQPDVIIGYGLDNTNPTIDNLQRNGLKVIINGDWNEKTPLGKAEWIKLFGALYGKEKEAEAVFSDIEKEYLNAFNLGKSVKTRPTALAGAVFENRWNLPQGESWGALLIRDAGGRYLWEDTKGTGSLSLSFEAVLDKARDAEFWIGPGQFTSLDQMVKSNPHYSQFRAFKEKKIYSFSIKKGKTGGHLYYELAQNRPDLVLKDVLKILHPELLPEYQPFFFQQLQ